MLFRSTGKWNGSRRSGGKGIMEFKIENGVLKKCWGDAENVTIPEGVTSIGYAAFETVKI